MVTVGDIYDVIPVSDWTKFEDNSIEQYLSNSKYIKYCLVQNLPGFLQNNSYTHPIVIRCTTGDNTINEPLTIPSFVYKLYYTNLNLNPTYQTQAIPYGLIDVHRGLIQKTEHNQTKKRLCYCNFSMHTTHLRPALWNTCKNKKFIECETPLQNTPTYDNITYFYNKVAQSKFTICPPGNGIDTYRMWETLYLNSIPVVIKSPFTSHFTGKLPILEIENYDILTEEFLHQQYSKIQSHQYNMNMLNRNYWIKQWYADVLNLESIYQ